MTTFPEIEELRDQDAAATFRWHLATNEVFWSAGMFQLYGYEPGAIVPTLELLPRHKHPDDLSHWVELVEHVRTDHVPFAFEHRIITVDGAEKTIIATVRAVVDDFGQVEALTGSSIDVTGIPLEHFASPDGPIDGLVALVRNLRTALNTRDLIGQAKGVLMERHSISGDEAFDLLKYVSQDQNRKLRDVADHLLRVGEFPAKPA